MIIMHVDGSSTKYPGANYQYSWGIVAEHDDQTVEILGQMPVSKEDNSNGANPFEAVAWVKAYLYAKEQGFKPEEMAFYTDDAQIAYAQFFLHHPNNQGNGRVKLCEFLRKICSTFFYPELYDELLYCLTKARFIKVKGHRDTIYNLRVDYLAKIARDTTKQPLPFEEWLSKGFLNYTENGPFMWLAPFARTKEAA